MDEPREILTTEAELRERYRPPAQRNLEKVAAALSPEQIRFLERSPFLCIGTADAEGRQDVSPRGEPPGFVRVLDPRTLLIPDRKGNNRLDTLTNLLQHPRVALVILVPGVDDVLRVNGTARVVADPALLELCAEQGKLPATVLHVTVEEVYLHCGKALKRSALWDPPVRHERAELLRPDPVTPEEAALY